MRQSNGIFRRLLLALPFVLGTWGFLLTGQRLTDAMYSPLQHLQHLSHQAQQHLLPH